MMVRSLKVADGMKQKYAIVTYDLAVAQKAYAIQSLKAPAFDRLIILLGNFHLEMAFFGALGTYLADSGIENLLTEVSVLAEGSLAGFMKGKFYNRCTRIHQILAAVMERASFERYMDLLSDEEASFIKKVMDDSDSTVGHCQTVIENALFKDIMKHSSIVSWMDNMEAQQYTGPSMCTLSTGYIENYSVLSASTVLMDTSKPSQVLLKPSLL